MIYLYFHNGSNNHGCEAIVRSTQKIIGQEMILCSRDKESDLKYGIDNLMPVHKDVAVPLRKYSLRWIMAAISHKIRHDDYLYTVFSREEFFDQIKPGDICLSIGGDNYCYAGKDTLGYYNREIHRRGGRTVLWGCSFEPDDLTDSLAEDLEQYDVIIARESLSYETLRKVNKNTALLSDPAFQLPTDSMSLPTGIIKGNTVGINVSPLIIKGERREGITKNNYEKLIQFIITNTDMQIALIPHVVQEGNDDREPLSVLYNEFKPTNRIVLIEDHNACELKGIISNCRFFVGARTHATIAAYSTGVPTLVVGYSVKAKGIARDIFGTEEHYVLPVQNLEKDEDLVQAFRWIVDNEESIRTRLGDVMPDYRAKSLTAGELIRRLQNDAY